MANKVVSIKVLNPQQAWYPGSSILGEVQFTCTEQVDIQSISIRFKGKAKNRFTRGTGQHSTTYRSKWHLFALNQTLFQGPFTLKPGSMSWPFQFVIPLDCSMARGDDLAEEPMYDVSPSQLLPPTFSSFEFRKECSIVYALKAEMHSSKTFSTSRKFETPIRIIQPSSYQPEQFARRMSTHRFSIQTLHLDSEIGDRDLTFKERMRTAFKSDSLPTAGFTIDLELPEGVAVYGPINPVMYLQHGAGTVQAADRPPVFLKSFSLSLKTNIFIRTSGMFGEHNQDWGLSQQVCQWTGKASLSEAFEISNLFPRGVLVPPGTASTFRTFNIAIRYRLKAKFTIECATKTRDGEYILPVVVLGPSGQQSNMNTVSMPLPMMEEEQQLPVYSKEGDAINAGGL